MDVTSNQTAVNQSEELVPLPVKPGVVITDDMVIEALLDE